MIECGYENVNMARLTELSKAPHYRRLRRGPLLVQADGYPQKAKTNQRRRHPGGMSVAKLGEDWTPLPGRDIIMLGPVDADGRREKYQLGIWRGLDKAVVAAMENNYIGQTLRMLRAQKGCGRPFITNLWQGAPTDVSETPRPEPSLRSARAAQTGTARSRILGPDGRPAARA